MVISEISLYNALKSKLGDQDAQTIIEGIKHEVKTEFEIRKDLLASKQDLSDLELRLSKQIGDTRTDVIKWMFIFWIGQLGSFIAIAKFLFHQ